ncbi:hypothetical protein BS47DRAFT_1362294 [Hydnum rufescens UP504]|uniref:Uncharacterized protein n=1 Tax=Hydnum rufescens UP504 TaxID=1448309 RepID=A0A9P6DX64_9AGAM|nr:hypothetical protein BS47DRAFT_1362294 [Hydnum rufescens UP504]
MSTHGRSVSQELALTSLSSGEFLNNVTAIIESSKAISDLVDRAEKLTAKLVSHEEYNPFPYGSPDSKIKLDRVLEAMLSNAFQANDSHKMQNNLTPSEYATPTLDRMAARIVAGVPEILRRSLRTRYWCCGRKLSVQSDSGQSNVEPLFTINACHILRRAVGIFDASRPAFSTPDILSHYASVPEDTITAIASLIDDPFNVRHRKHSIALPNPLFIPIHVAIAGALHMSGVAEELESVLDRPGARGAPGTILVGDDFEEVYKLGCYGRLWLCP